MLLELTGESRAYGNHSGLGIQKSGGPFEGLQDSLRICRGYMRFVHASFAGHKMKEKRDNQWESTLNPKPYQT